MIHQLFYVSCDYCGKRATEAQEETETDAILSARNQGWRRIFVENGSTRDYCPTCVHRREMAPLLKF